MRCQTRKTEQKCSAAGEQKYYNPEIIFLNALT